METLAAIGLAGNIIAFVDFGYKLFVAAKEIHASASGRLRADDNVVFLTHQLKNLTVTLNSDSRPAPCPTDPAASLKRFVSECQQWSVELLSLVEELRLGGCRRKRDTLRVAWIGFKSKKRKEHLEAALDKCRAQLSLELLQLSRSEVLKHLADLDASGRSRDDEISSLKANIASLRSSLEAQVIGDEFVVGGRQLLKSSDDTLLKLQRRAFLSMLSFDVMDDRYENIAQAHSASFHWLLEDMDYEPYNKLWDHEGKSVIKVGANEDREPRAQMRSSFVDWLGQKSGIFHITGKPGSGKSTLMKYIYKHQDTQRHLEAWSGGKKLTIAKYFFWRIGNESQRNLHGFQRTLLYQILRGSPDLTPIAFPSQWNATDGLRDLKAIHLSRSDVEAGLEKIFSTPSIFQDRRFALFIDGLDEFDGRHSELLQRLFGWVNNNPSDVKLCVSSRPWNVFLDAFVNCATLKIHQFTRDGIAVAATDRLATCQPCLSEGEETLALIGEIVDKAEGVYLWVALVLNVLEDGIINGDGIRHLRAKVRAFPSELNELYEHLFYSIHRCDRPEAFSALMMAYHPTNTKYQHYVLDHHCFGKLVHDPAYLVDLSHDRILCEDLKAMVALTTRRLNGICKGFLEIGPEAMHGIAGNGCVRFMHVTVEEFLSQEHIMSSIRASIPEFDWAENMCTCVLVDLKIIEAEGFEDEGGVASVLATLFRDLKAIMIAYLNGNGDYSSGVLAVSELREFMSKFRRLTTNWEAKRKITKGMVGVSIGQWGVEVMYFQDVFTLDSKLHEKQLKSDGRRGSPRWHVFD